MAVILPPPGAFLVVTTDGAGVPTGFKWVKVRDDAQHPRVLRTVPHNRE